MSCPATIKIVDQTAIALGIDDREACTGKLGKIAVSADLLELGSIKRVLERDRVGLLLVADQLDAGRIDTLVDGIDKMFWLQEVSDPVICTVVLQYRAQKAHLGFMVAGRLPIHRIAVVNGRQGCCHIPAPPHGLCAGIGESARKTGGVMGAACELRGFRG